MRYSGYTDSLLTSMVVGVVVEDSLRRIAGRDFVFLECLDLVGSWTWIWLSRGKSRVALNPIGVPIWVWWRCKVLVSLACMFDYLGIVDLWSLGRLGILI